MTPTGVFVEQRGRGDPVIFLHGSGLDLHMWDDQADVAAARFRVIRYDLRGHGRTVNAGVPRPGYADLLGVMDEVGVARASLVGLSAGAQIAVDFALAYPARVERLVLASPTVTGYTPRGSFEWFAPIAAAARARRYNEAAALYAASSFLRIEGDSVQQGRLLRIALANARVWADTTGRPDLKLPSVVDRLSGIRVPALVIVGERDTDDVRRIAAMLADSIPCASRVEIAGSGHMVNMTAPAAFNGALLAFLGAPRAKRRAECPTLTP